MSIWESYPADYREAEVQAIITVVTTGECVAVIGLSGAGKSNLTGFLAHRTAVPNHSFVLVDRNRLLEPSPTAFLRLVRRTLTAITDETGYLDWPALAQLFKLERRVTHLATGLITSETAC